MSLYTTTSELLRRPGLVLPSQRVTKQPLRIAADGMFAARGAFEADKSLTVREAIRQSILAGQPHLLAIDWFSAHIWERYKEFPESITFKLPRWEVASELSACGYAMRHHADFLESADGKAWLASAAKGGR